MFEEKSLKSKLLKLEWFLKAKTIILKNTTA